MRKKPLKMYVLLRKDLGTVYSGVQAGHALAQYSISGDLGLYEKWNNGILVYLSVPNREDLLLWRDKLNDNNKPFRQFNEPDLGGQITAISCIDTGDIFKDLPLA